MISIFQIFRMLIGLIVFIFVLFFFLRLAGMYSGLQERGKQFEAANIFDYTVMQTYTSGNPTVFSGFEDTDVLVYDPPKIKFDAGQKTLSVPTFFIAGKGEILTEKRCIDYSWWKFCWVYAFPESYKIIFNPLENTQDSRDLMSVLVGILPDGMLYGYCNGDEAQVAGKGEFLNYLGTLGSESFTACEVPLPEYSRLVIIGGRANLTENTILLSPSGAEISGHFSGDVESRNWLEVLDVAAFVTGGGTALDYKNSVFSSELESVVKIMLERTKIVRKEVLVHNQQPCLECSTPFPLACGWIDYAGHSHQSTIYSQFISSLSALKSAIPSGSYHFRLDDTVIKYEVLKGNGCE